VDPSQLPAAATREVDFDRDIRPILEASCLGCHGAERPKSRFRLDDRDAALKGGSQGVDIVPGDSAASPLIHYVARVVEDMEMPPAGKGRPLSAEEVGLLRAWIDQGVKWSTVPKRQLEFSFAPAVQWISVDGNERKFREHYSQAEGWSGGLSQLELRDTIDANTEFVLRGRGLCDQHDCGISLSLARREVGFVRAGFDTYRRYYDDHGGYAPAEGIPPFRLDRDLSLDLGRAWFDVGMTLPDLPRITIGYEYQSREGEVSTLHWGQDPATPGVAGRPAMYPAYRAIDEHTHILKFDISHTLGGWGLDDAFRAEFYELHNRQFDYGEVNYEQNGTYREDYQHVQLANALRAEKQLADWLFVAGGYLYTHLEGDGAFRQTVTSLLSTPPTPSAGDQSDPITLEQESQTLNLNARLGPWDGLTFTSGVQSELLRRHGFSDLFTPGFPNALPAPQSSSIDQTTLEERVGLRYDRSPFTVLYAEGRLQQEWIDHYEQGALEDGFADDRDFARDTDTTSDRREAGGGITVSPWPAVSWDTSYWRRHRRTDYDQVLDTNGVFLPFIFSGNGYPGFIEQRKINGDEVETRLVLRPRPWLKTTLKYQYRSAEYDTRTDDFTTTDGSSRLYAGGEILAGDRDDHLYSVNLTLTPWRRFNLASTFSYINSRLVTGVNNGSSVVPWEGETYSLVCSAGYVVDQATDLRLAYAYSKANYEQPSTGENLPLGMRYGRHGVTASLTRRIKKNVTTSLQYGFFAYREPTADGANDYTAHLIVATFGWALP
jgi:hypothetical protein